MKLSYKLSDGRHVEIFEQGLFEAVSGYEQEFNKKLTIAVITDTSSENVVDRVPVRIIKEDGRYFINVNRERIYLDDYEFLRANDLVNKFKNKEVVSLDEFIISVINNDSQLSFVEPRVAKNTDSNDTEKYIKCMSVEKYYSKVDWLYRIETMPVNAEESEIYGRACYNIAYYYYRIVDGKIKINLEKSYIRKLEKKD